MKGLTSKACNNHLLTNKGKTNKKVLIERVIKANSKMVKNLLPYK